MPQAAETAPANQGSGPGTWVDPYGVYNFRLKFGGAGEARFARIGRFSAQVHAIPYREGGDPVVHYVPGRVEYSAVELKYGLTDSTELWEWFMKSLAGEVDRRHVSIIVLGPDGRTEKVRWDLEQAWPCEWEGAALDALGREVAIESLKLVFERIERV
jgi:phage tail-like protein